MGAVSNCQRADFQFWFQKLFRLTLDLEKIYEECEMMVVILHLKIKLCWTGKGGGVDVVTFASVWRAGDTSTSISKQKKDRNFWE